MSSGLMIYGATGYVGEHVARTAASLSVKVMVAGRDAAKLDRIASETGLEGRAFGLDDFTAIDRALNSIAVVLNCAGPFKYTAEPLVAGCLRARAPTISTSPARSLCSRRCRRRTNRRRRAASCCSPGRLRRGSNRLPSAASEKETRQPLALGSRSNRSAPPACRRARSEPPSKIALRRSRPPQRQAHAPKPAAKAIPVDFGAGPVKPGPVGRRVCRLFQHRNSEHQDYVAAPPSLQRQLPTGRVIAPLTNWRRSEISCSWRYAPGRAQSFGRGPKRTSGAKSPTKKAVTPWLGCTGRKRALTGRRSQPSGPRTKP